MVQYLSTVELWQQIWRAGSKVSSGFGLWSHEIMFTEDAPTVARVWTETLTALGYSPVDIVLYGDWRDGRHMADEMWDMHRGAETGGQAIPLQEYIVDRAAPAEKVRNLNAEQVSPEAIDNVKTILGYFDEVTS
tara:strand:- start:703 stop:1104 length:402 start_codon:yes stop_codon:yes gene_type:complete